MTNYAQNNDVVTSSVSRVTGCVKWFNNKAGYGFVTVSSGPHAGDVFVHHSAINVGEEQYRFLVQGEYVEFDRVHVEGGNHEWQAANVTGPNSGRLMCETRRVVRSTRPSHSEPDGQPDQEWQQTQRRPHRPSSAPSVSQSRPPRQPSTDHRQGDQRRVVDGNDEYEWLLVRKYAQGTRPPVRRVRRVVASQE